MRVAEIGETPTDLIMETPFHSVLNWYHHSTLDQASLLNLMKWSRCFATVDKSMSHRRNNLLALTALQAWDRTPIKERRSLFLHAFSPLHFPSSALRRSNFSAGRRISSATVSSSMPRKEIVVAGHSSFSGSVGRPTSSHVSC